MENNKAPEKSSGSEKAKVAISCGLCVLLFLSVVAFLVFGYWYYVKMGY